MSKGHSWGLEPGARVMSKGHPIFLKKKQGGVGRLFPGGIAFFWPVLKEEQYK
jgi:hypothetical protein